ncbi:MAG TPA: hypothetical protein RMH85_10075 [Polyangiaceae bacterium LLY-WYZ-15_(1-7)]|nr:hypothetical protein [Polyangiaceae bacterium LLY-WYZ-15_(1-7)]HJL06348.1 hypothetical protein [Polyangiaceae bacterium LLY-WYZ-15_(1-7)]HJL08837.1 hypothetical protein [Polyangiaceae bacterium LLY-WYZ-15_(1-7)]HJL21365.1 hypothetical protein [Polyangiaceae bacterium LLY-WYZ-15_(1-7)]HJL32968.1 hypothetical protein [Polyangiaceae bacterium LLY-WYZ-15_(1-7)]
MRGIRLFGLVLASTLVLGAGCKAPGAEKACGDYCDAVTRCDITINERTCLWACLAGVEWREDKGRRCGKKAREEYSCLGDVNDCEFLLTATTYRRDDPCAEAGNARSNACNEDGMSPAELVPLSGELDDASLERIDEYDGVRR